MGQERPIQDFPTDLYQACGSRLYRLLLSTVASQVAMSDGVDLETRIRSMERTLAANTTTRFADNLDERDRLYGLIAGDRVYVTDAAPDVKGGAMYMWLPETGFKKIWSAQAPLDLGGLVAPFGGLKMDEGGKLAVDFTHMGVDDFLWLAAACLGAGLAIANGKVAVKLSSATDSFSEDEAATPRAVAAVNEVANVSRETSEAAINLATNSQARAQAASETAARAEAVAERARAEVQESVDKIEALENGATVSRETLVSQGESLASLESDNAQLAARVGALESGLEDFEDNQAQKDEGQDEAIANLATRMAISDEKSGRADANAANAINLANVSRETSEAAQAAAAANEAAIAVLEESGREQAAHISSLDSMLLDYGLLPGRIDAARDLAQEAADAAAATQARLADYVDLASPQCITGRKVIATNYNVNKTPLVLRDTGSNRVAGIGSGINLRFEDAASNPFGWLCGCTWGNQSSLMYLEAVGQNAAGNLVYNRLQLFIDGQGNCGVSRSNNPPDASNGTEIPTTNWSRRNLVQKSGDNMTGALRISLGGADKLFLRNTEDTYNVAPSVNRSNIIELEDKNGKIVGQFAQVHRPAGSNEVSLAVLGQNNVYQYLSIVVKADGTTYANCPTPAGASKSNEIATCAWVRSYVLAATSKSATTFSTGASTLATSQSPSLLTLAANPAAISSEEEALETLQALDNEYLTPRTLAGLSINDESAFERYEEHENLAAGVRERLADLRLEAEFMPLDDFLGDESGFDEESS